MTEWVELEAKIPASDDTGTVMVHPKTVKALVEALDADPSAVELRALTEFGAYRGQTWRGNEIPDGDVKFTVVVPHAYDRKQHAQFYKVGDRAMVMQPNGKPHRAHKRDDTIQETT